jgi:chitin-binding protein
MRHTKTVCCALFALASIPSLSSAHGTMEIPVSRVLNCYNEGAENPKSDACKEAKIIGGPGAAYNWNGISQNVPLGDHQNFVPNGMLCSGGNSLHRGYDLGRADWTSTAIVPDSRGNFEFVYRATAPHATEYFKFYVTKNGWNKEAALNWSNLEEFATLSGTPQLVDGRYKMTVKLPKNKTGQHIIYTVWKRSDPVGETFYSCSDVKFSGEDGPPIDPPNNPWKDQGSVTAHDNLPANSTVTLRIFDAHARDVEKQTVTLNATTGLATNWPYELALKVNAQSSSMRIGVIKQTGKQVTIVPEKSATSNHVYLNDSYPGYRYNIDIKRSNDDITPPGGDEWKEGVSYQRDQVVSYQGKKYRCLQKHTAWAGANWNPQKEIALWTAL